MNISFKVRGVKAVQSFLASVPRGALRVVLQAFTDYVIGNDAHGLRHNEPYKYVSRKAAGYKTSPAQIRFFFATGIWKSVNGKVVLNPYTRTNETSKAWKSVPSSNAYQMKIVNEKESAYYTRDDKGQARQPAKVGWRKVTQVLADNYLGGIRAGVQAFNKWLKEKGK